MLSKINEDADDEVQRIPEASQVDSFRMSSSIMSETSMHNASSTSNFLKKFDTHAAVKRKSNLQVRGWAILLPRNQPCIPAARVHRLVYMLWSRWFIVSLEWYMVHDLFYMMYVKAQ